MRAVLALLLFMVVAPATAADWGHYDNARFGYGLDIPPGFEAEGESDNGDGQVFSTPTAKLTVFGGNIVEGDFESAVKQSQMWAGDQGWTITYQVTTPSKASFSGTAGARILYVRLIALCGGSALGAFQIEYSRADLTAFDPIVTRLVRSLAANGAC